MKQLDELKRIYDNYCYWASDNPSLVTLLETLSGCASFIIPGNKLGRTNLIAEGMYSFSRLYMLLNDHAFGSVRKIAFHASSHNGYSLKMLLTIIDYLEVTVEVAAGKRKMPVISTIQTLKAFIKLLLLFKEKVGLLTTPPIMSFPRQELNRMEIVSSEFYTLNSGRTIRRVKDGEFDPESFFQLQYFNNNKEPLLNEIQIIAEAIYVLKPLAHLIALSKCGQKSYKPWLISLCMDLLSSAIYLYHPSAKVHSKQMVDQLNNRQIWMMLYLLRSPLYEDLTNKFILDSLLFLKTILPCFGWIFNMILLHIPKWQKRYFYIWSQ